MYRVWPNPTRASVNIEYALRQTGSAGVSIYDLTGSLVKRWTRSNAGTGDHVIIWNGTDASEHRVSPGIYFVRIETAEGSMSKKLQLLGD
jgi:flagellar hook assembly protein FlgD